MKYKGILLDIDNTLYAYEPMHQYALQCLFHKIEQDFGVAEVDIKSAFKMAKLYVKQDTPETASSHNRLLYIQKLCELLSLDALRNSLSLYETYWQNFLDKMALSDGAQVFFKRTEDTPICLLTDLTAHIQHRKVAKLGLNKWARFMVTSEEAGCEKPHPYMFHLALSKLGLQPGDVCMVGDSYKKDIQGAARLGIPAYWLNVEGKSRPSDFDIKIMTEIKDLRELPWI